MAAIARTHHGVVGAGLRGRARGASYERATVIASEADRPSVPVLRPLDRRLAGGFAVLLAGLVPWTVFLAFTLHARFEARHWNLAWVGFDTVLAAALAITAWAAWSRRQILVAAALATASMLLCDAWFDVATSLGTPDQALTIATALLAELPLAAFLFWLARRIMLGTFAACRDELEHSGRVRLRHVPLLLAAATHADDEPARHLSASVPIHRRSRRTVVGLPTHDRRGST